MSVAHVKPPQAWSGLAAKQAGVVARRQLRTLGVSRSIVRTQLRSGRWQRVLPGVFVIFTGPLPGHTRIWAALLYAGPRAKVSHETAAWLHGIRDDLASQIQVIVPHGYRHRPSRAWVHVRQSRHFTTRLQSARTPPRTGVEDTVLDLTESARTERGVIDIVLRACQRRLTTTSRLSLAMRARKRLRWRALLRELLTDVRAGVQSPLERRYLHDVERAHRLPRGHRNHSEPGVGSNRYRDVRYRRWGVLVELDGRAAHPEDEREKDDLRDNEATELQDRTLRYGWRSITGRPCQVAAQVARILNQQGWRSSPLPCGPGCQMVPEWAPSDV